MKSFGKKIFPYKYYTVPIPPEINRKINIAFASKQVFLIPVSRQISGRAFVRLLFVEKKTPLGPGAKKDGCFRRL